MDKKWKRGDVGPDGRVFWKYNSRSKGGEHWVTYEKFSSMVTERKNQRLFDRISGQTAELSRRKNLRIRFREIGRCDSFDDFLGHIGRFNSAHQMSGAIFRLIPSTGQTLAELIHDLSGYPMHVCDQIANPHDPEPEKLDNPPEPSTMAGGTDLF